MSSKLISTTLLLSFISIVQATEKVQIAVIESQGVVLTPNKSAIQKFAHGGFAALEKLKKEQQKASEDKRTAQQELEKQRYKEITQLIEKQEQLIIEKKETEEKLIQLEEREQQLEAEAKQAKERAVQLEAQAKQAKEEARHAKEEAKRAKEEAQRLEREAKQDPNVDFTQKGEIAQDIQAKMKELEEENNDLLDALATLRGGQTSIPTSKVTFVPHSNSYIHTTQLRAPNEELDAELEKKLQSIQSNLEALLESVTDDTSLKAVQKMITKQQIKRLTDAAEDFEAAIFLRVFNEVQSQLPKLAANETFRKIEEDANWFIENKTALSNAGEHRAYIQRQNDVAMLIKSKQKEFEEFYEDYLDRIVAEMCNCLTPITGDGPAVTDAKLAFRYKLQTSSIPGVRNYLGQLTKFGTNDAFLNTTFLKMNKRQEYDDFKDVLIAYSSLFDGLGENVKLVEELLNLRFFQNRYKVCKEELIKVDMNAVHDPAVKKILEIMIENDVLNYNATKSALFSAPIPKVLGEYMKKTAIMPGEFPMAEQVKRILIAYCQIDYFVTNLASANPKVTDFHKH